MSSSWLKIVLRGLTKNRMERPLQASSLHRCIYYAPDLVVDLLLCCVYVDLTSASASASAALDGTGWALILGLEVSSGRAGDEGGDPREDGPVAHELNSTTATLRGLFQVMSLVAGRLEVA